jgi:GNAT superfamily N-acetyltransferase
MLEIALRPYNKVWDEEFVYSTWLKSYRLSPTCRGVPLPIYNKGQRARINKIIDEGNILVATNPDEERVIYGYIVYGSEVVHYIYVKGAYRKMGIARALYEATPPQNSPATLWTHRSNQLWIDNKLKTDPEFLHWVYDPFLYETV